MSFVLISSKAATQQSGPAAFPLVTRAITDNLGRRVTYPISRPGQAAPLLLMIQGSGCGTVLQGEGTSRYSTFYDLLPLASEGRFAVMAVEKPFATAKASGGTAQGCDAAFNRDFTAERWLVALRAALDDAGQQPNVNSRRIVVLGGSEGAVMASLLAGRDRRITDVIAIGGSGTTQLFDFIATAYARCFDRSHCIDDVEEQVAAIRAAPDSADQFAWGTPISPLVLILWRRAWR